MKSKRIDNKQGIYSVDYTNKYYYEDSNPYAVTKINDGNSGAIDYYEWDKKGNMIYQIDEKKKRERNLCWTEDNRLQGYRETGEGESAYYNYTAGGERNLKFTGQTIDISQNGNEYGKPILEHPTLYASELITINEKGYTKHYFEEGKRICSKIGGGFNNITEDDLKKQVETLIEGYEEQIRKERDGVMHTFDGCMKVEPEIESYESNDLFRVIADNYIGKDEKEPAFYYHSDHLGSASYVTNGDGKVTQTLNYLPYGEDWVDLQYFDLMPAVIFYVI